MKLFDIYGREIFDDASNEELQAKVTPRVIADFVGNLEDLNTNEEYPSTEYFGTYFDSFGLHNNRYYLIEYNGETYGMYGGTTLNLGGIPDLSSPVVVGNPGLILEWILRQSAETEDEAALTFIMVFLVAILYGLSMGDSEIPFQFIGSQTNEGEDGLVLFLVNNGTAECSLRVTEFDIEVKEPINRHLQADYEQFDENHPGFVKNRLAGIEKTDMVLFDGVIGDLDLTAITNEDGETIAYQAPLNTIGGMEVLMVYLQFLLTNADTSGEDCVLVKYDDTYRTLYIPDESILDGLDEETLEAMEAWLEANPNTIPYGNISLLDSRLPDNNENFLLLLNLSFLSEAATLDTAEGESTDEPTDEEVDDSFAITAIMYTNITNASLDTPCFVGFGKCKEMDRKFLPKLTMDDLPYQALAYNRSSKNMMIRDSENNYEYIIISKNGVLEIYCRCSSIEVTTNPTKTAYKVGEYFDQTGMVVIATCQDGTTKDVTDKCTCSYTSTAFSSINTKEVTIVFNEAGWNYKDTVAVTVTE